MEKGDEKRGKLRESDLIKLKERYLPLKAKYDLPEFDDLNKMFSIEKIDGNETDFLLREIRRIISESLSNYINILENLLNPSNAPFFVYSVVKVIDEPKKKKLSEIYMRLAKDWVPLLQLDLRYREESEADFIKRSFNLWKDSTSDFYDILEFIKKNWENNSEDTKSGYLG